MITMGDRRMDLFHSQRQVAGSCGHGTKLYKCEFLA